MKIKNLFTNTINLKPSIDVISTDSYPVLSGFVNDIKRETS